MNPDPAHDHGEPLKPDGSTEHLAPTSSDDDLLSTELCVEDDGHLSEIAMTAIADGEHALVPASVISHAVTCARCTDRIGAAALLTLRTQMQLEALRHAPPLPLGWLATASMIAVVGMLPSAWGAAHNLSSGGRGIASSAARFSDVLSVILSAIELVGTHPLAPVAAACALCCAGALLAVSASRRRERTLSP